jgi:hypothetical protein
MRPTLKGAINVKALTTRMATPGVMAREAIAVATISAASWNPLVKSNTTTTRIVTMSKIKIRSIK